MAMFLVDIKVVVAFLSLIAFVASNGFYYASKHPQPWKRHLPAALAILSTISVIWAFTNWIEGSWHWVAQQFQTQDRNPPSPAPEPVPAAKKIRSGNSAVRHHKRAASQHQVDDATADKARNLAYKALLPICSEFAHEAIASGKLPEITSSGTPITSWRVVSVGELPNATGELSCKVFYLGPTDRTFQLRVRDDCSGNPSKYCMTLLSVSEIPN